MADELIYRDVLLWSEREGALLRRLAAGERVNDAIDWENVIEEIESVGRSELRAVESLLSRAIQHMLKILVWPNGPVEHWRNEALIFLGDARAHWAPSMGQRLDMREVCADARDLFLGIRFEGRRAPWVPALMFFEVRDVLRGRVEALPDVDALLVSLREVLAAAGVSLPSAE